MMVEAGRQASKQTIVLFSSGINNNNNHNSEHWVKVFYMLLVRDDVNKQIQFRVGR